MERNVWARAIKKWVILVSLIVVAAAAGRENGAEFSESAMEEGGANKCLTQRCGDVNVSFPFKLKSEAGCPSFSSFFDLECDIEAGGGGGQLYLSNVTHNDTGVQLRVLEIQNDSLIVDATGLASVMNGSQNGNCSAADPASLVLPAFPGPFFIADDNLFGSFGCTMGILLDAQVLPNASSTSDDYSNVQLGGCSVQCPGDDEKNLKCGGRTCCITNLPLNTSTREVIYYVDQSPFATDQKYNMSPCNTNYATLFYPDYSDFSKQSYGLKLNWALPSNQTNSSMDIRQSTNFSCSNHTNIIIVQEVPGYRCSCVQGFDGDGYSQGFGCSAITLLGLLIGGIVIFAIYWRQKIKKMYFLQNGGMQLQELIVKVGGKRHIRFFTVEELKVATNNYAEHMKLGMGGYGSVYKGVLEDGSLVAIKKANKEREGGNEQFLNEINILMQINHRNIVRLLGCCMENVVPLLVYEYVSNGNVRENLDQDGAGAMGWEQRLKVARQIVEALAYLHAAASPPILHRDVKSANILIDHHLDAKVADFGISRLIPEGVQHVSTAVQGTIGYLDPEYFQTLQLTDKSDVYSVGVILVELITGLKPIDNQRKEPRFVNLSYLFIDRMKCDRGEELIDPRLKEPSTTSSKTSRDNVMVRSIMEVATLALRCLDLHGEERPSMSLIVDELHHISRCLEEVANESLPLIPLNSKVQYHHHEAAAAAAVTAQNVDDLFVESTSSATMFICNPTLPR